MKRQFLISSLILLFIQTVASAAVLYVPSRDYPTIQSAINAAVNDDVVVVAPGIWTGPGNVDLDFGGKAITVRSEINPDNPNPSIIASTIIDCQGTRYNPHRAFYFHNGEGPNSKVLGFTIINGYARGLAGAAGRFGVDPPVPYESIDPDDANGIPRAERGSDSLVSDGYGGAVLCEGASPTIQYCVITNSTVTGAQGGDGAPGQSGTWTYQPPYDVNDPNADVPEPVDVDGGQWGGHGGDGYGNGYGGAIACRAGSSPIISDCTISDNFARGGCGGDGGNGGNAVSEPPNAFPPNYSGGYESFGGDAGSSNGDGIGGGIYCDDASSPAITNCTFSNNIAATGRAVGGLAGQGNTIPEDEGGPATAGADGLVFSTGGIAGGAAYYDTGSDANFTNCTFTSNKAYEAYMFYDPSFGEDISTYTVGGALYSVANNTITLDDCKFTGNLGGAVYCESGCNLNFDDCLFTDNSEIANGGAVYISPGCTVDIQNSIFGGNSAYDDGGALKCRSDATLTNCSFGNNVADSDNDGYGYGGAIDAYLPGTTLIIDVNNCSFTGNQSIYGGGFSSENFDANFTNCYFIGNTAQEGGGLDLVNGDVFVTGGVVRGNNATDGDGGGFDCSYTITQIRDCTISDNSADGIYPTGGSGGAINFYGWAPTQTVFNCLITGNSATIDGGAIFCRNAAPEIGNCTFSGNLAGGYGGAIFSDFISDPNITDCIFESCSNHAIHEQDVGGNAIVKYSLFYGNPDGDYYDSGTGLTYTGAGEIGSIPGGSNNLYGDPLFVTGPLGEFYLRQQPVQPLPQSPAVDTGSADANDPNIGLDTYTTRTDSIGDAGTVDMGHHYGDPSGLREVQLTATVVGGHGMVEPTEPAPISYDPISGIYTYYRGTVVTLTATPEAGYRVASWSGTISDGSTSLTNIVVMSSDKAVSVQFEKPRVILVPADYPNIPGAIRAAGEGDQVVISPGLYRPGDLGGIVISGKNITLTSINPDDPNVVADTILEGYRISISNVGPETVLTGFTMRNTYWITASGLDGQDPGDSGFNGLTIRSGAIDITDASPTLVNIVIDNISITAGDGGDGVNGNDDNVNGGNGGWGGSAYGGAIYFENSSPTLKGIQIINCAAYGGTGGDGGNGNDDPPGYGGRGGSWTFEEHDEAWWEEIGLGWDYPRDRYGNYLLVGTYEDYWMYTAMGAAAYIDSTSKPTFIDCTFADNQTGSGYCGVGGSGPLGSPGPGNHRRIQSFGTGIYCEVGSAPTFIDCNFSDNVADSDVPTTDHSFYLTYGGGLACGTLTPKENPGSAHSAKLINCTFTDNAATIGGAVFWADTAPSIEDCNFSDNYAYQGGAMFCGENSMPLIVGSSFTQNDTGYVYIDDPNLYYTVLGLTVGPPIEDVLGLGGAMVCSSSGARIVDCLFNNNTTSCSGGGIYTTGNEKLLVKNCLITENSADRDGGGISANWHSEPNIINCTIAENIVTGDGFAASYGGGVCCSYEAYALITNSIIWGNYALNGWDLAISTGFEHDPRPAYVKVAYSDIKGGETAVFVDTGCTLVWDSTNLSGTSDDVPLFVSDYVGERYYLSQPYVVPPDPNQTELSPCVDAGSTYAYLLDMYRHTTRTDRVIDAGIADVGYHHLLTTDLVGDFDFNYMVNISDLALFLLHWLEECGPPDWCHGADLNRDGVVNFIDYIIFVENYGLSDTTPPEPDPMTWAVAPNSIGPTSIYMAATTAYDNATGPYVEYYFKCVFGGGHDRGWSPSPTYTDTGLVRGNEYGYQVKARDTSANRNETEWSIIGYAVPGEDVMPPVTDPNAYNPYKSTWAMPPTLSTGRSILMVATTATDENGVEYYFECTFGNGHNSGWQGSPTYEDMGLDPNTTYTYRVRTRDGWDPPNQNYGFWSDEASATTPEGVPPLPDPAEWLTPPEWRTDPNTGRLGHYMEAEPADDAVNNPCMYYFECVNGSGLDSGWQLSNVYAYFHTSSCVYVVRYRDAVGNVGQDSDPAYTGARPW